jgi:DNA-binding CsgD family transcriptional regulator
MLDSTCESLFSASGQASNPQSESHHSEGHQFEDHHPFGHRSESHDSLLEQTRRLAVALLSRRGGAQQVSELSSLLFQSHDGSRCFSEAQLLPTDPETAWTLLGSVVVDALFQLGQREPAVDVSAAICSRETLNPSAVLAVRRTQLANLLHQVHTSDSRRAVLDCVAWVEPMVLRHDLDELERARAALTVARAWSALGHGESAAAWLESAAALFERVGQPGWVSAIRQEITEPMTPAPSLAPQTETPSPGISPNWMTRLSPAEVRVAFVVGTGCSDREAAKELFVSTRTIEYHLQSIFRKLGVKNRCELANLVGRAGSSAHNSFQTGRKVRSQLLFEHV